MKYLAVLFVTLAATLVSLQLTRADAAPAKVEVAARDEAAKVSSHEAIQTARGVVFHDANNNQKFDEGEKVLSGVRVSNGKTIVETNEQGRYELPVDDDTILFVIKPRDWRTPLSESKLPRFYYIHKPKGSPANFRYKGVAPTGPLPESIDFPLYPQKEPDTFKAVLFGDPQPRDQQEVDWVANDVVQELIGTDASFGVTLGDIAFNNLDTFESQNQAIALIGIPWYNVIGNHDINFDAPNDKLSDETFERVFGPAYYSFDYGSVHFIVLDDINWTVQENGKKGYRGGLGAEQLAFVKEDLSRVPDEQLVVLMMHIPLTGVDDRKELYRLIEKRKFCISISGHTHHHEHVFIKKEDGWQGPVPHHHIINVTVCGSWWSGAPDERGIPHSTMADGAPNGYTTITFDGTKYTLDYKAAGRDPQYQMQITAPDEVNVETIGKTPIYVNVFNGSEKSTVKMRIDDGDWADMDKTREIDPGFQAVVNAEEAITEKTWRKLPNPKASSHLWKLSMPEAVKPGVHLIHVRTTDMHGRTYDAQRVVRVVK